MRFYAPTEAHARALVQAAAGDGLPELIVAPSARGGRRRCRRRRHRDELAPAGDRARLARPRAPTSTPSARAVRRRARSTSRTRRRERAVLSTPRVCCETRPASSSWRSAEGRSSGPEPHPGRAGRGAGRPRARAGSGDRCADAVPLARDRREDLAAAELAVRTARAAGAGNARSSCDPARPRSRRRASGSPAPRCGRRSSGWASTMPRPRSGEARDAPADQLVQDPRRRERGSQRRPGRERARGLVTASAGNMAQGVAWVARELGRAARRSPSPSTRRRRSSTRSSGSAGASLKLPYDDWWNVHRDPAASRASMGCSSIRSRTRRVMAGNGTIGLEILEDLPDRRCGRHPLRRRRADRGDRERGAGARPGTQIYTAEPETGAALAAAHGGGRARSTSTTSRRSSTAPAAAACSTRCGRASMPLIDDALVATLDETADALRTLAERLRVIAEGAGALAAAAALAGSRGRRARRRASSPAATSTSARSHASLKESHRHERAPPERRFSIAGAPGPRRERLRALPADRRAARAAEDAGGAGRTATSCCSRPSTRARSCG